MVIDTARAPESEFGETLTEQLFFRADPDTKNRLSAIAQAEDRSVSYVIRRAISEYLDRVAAPNDGARGAA